MTSHYAPPAFEDKICPPELLTDRSRILARPLVFTNGCFDILHRGHVTYLGQARALGAAMVVALNSDASVKRLGKGDDRPVNRLEDRLAVMASLGCVDMVTWFDARTLDVLARQYDISYDAGVYDFDVHMEVEMTRYGHLLVPRLLRYEGNWDMLFKERERGVFTATLFDFTD